MLRRSTMSLWNKIPSRHQACAALIRMRMTFAITYSAGCAGRCYTEQPHPAGQPPGDGTKKESETINSLYGKRAESAMRGMLGPHGHADARESKALPIPGKATIEGTEYTAHRSTVFENWHHKCAAPVGWCLSKLGSVTCKMGNDMSESIESLQLQIIKGCNVFEIDGSATEHHQKISRGLRDTFEAFELDREGFVIVMRCGLIKQSPFDEQTTKFDATNVSAVRSRILPVVERFKASSLPAAQLKSGFRINELTDAQLAQMHLRRVSRTTAAGLSPDWLEAYFTNIAFNMRIECIDVVLLEGLHALFDDRPVEHIEDDILQIFAFLEQQVSAGTLQYYGISSEHLAPPVKRNYPDLPADAMLPESLLHPPKQPPVMNLYRLLALAERAAKDPNKHHLRFVQYPFNLTNHQALSTPLPYDENHTLCSLCKTLGITTLGYSPLEARNLMQLQERYHNFPMEPDLKVTRMNYFAICERCALKEMEVKDSFENGPASLPPIDQLFLASVFLCAQRQFTNLFFFKSCVNSFLMPRFRIAVTRFKESSPAELKEWCKQYEQLVNDFLQVRERLFEHKHGAIASQINSAIDRLSPTLSACPMLNQKAINFSTHGCDCLLCGFHVSRYFHEATELNPAKNGGLTVPFAELQALCDSPQVSYADASPPHPYMMEPVVSQGKISKQKSKALETTITIDIHNPKFPDIPEEDDEDDDDNNTERRNSNTNDADKKEKV